MTTREAWYIYWRRRRIIVRELSKAASDLSIYGNCYVSYNKAGEPTHIPLQDVCYERDRRTPH